MFTLKLSREAAYLLRQKLSFDVNQAGPIVQRLCEDNNLSTPILVKSLRTAFPFSYFEPDKALHVGLGCLQEQILSLWLEYLAWQKRMTFIDDPTTLMMASVRNFNFNNNFVQLVVQFQPGYAPVRLPAPTIHDKMKKAFDRWYAKPLEMLGPFVPLRLEDILPQSQLEPRTTAHVQVEAEPTLQKKRAKAEPTLQKTSKAKRIRRTQLQLLDSPFRSEIQPEIKSAKTEIQPVSSVEAKIRNDSISSVETKIGRPIRSKSQVKAKIRNDSVSSVEPKISRPVRSKSQVEAKISRPVRSKSQVEVKINRPVRSQSQVEVKINRPVRSQSQVEAKINRPVRSQSQVEAKINRPVRSKSVSTQAEFVRPVRAKRKQTEPAEPLAKRKQTKPLAKRKQSEPPAEPCAKRVQVAHPRDTQRTASLECYRSSATAATHAVGDPSDRRYYKIPEEEHVFCKDLYEKRKREFRLYFDLEKPLPNRALGLLSDKLKSVYAGLGKNYSGCFQVQGDCCRLYTVSDPIPVGRAAQIAQQLNMSPVFKPWNLVLLRNGKALSVN